MSQETDRYLLTRARIYTLGSKPQYFEDGAVLVEGTQIAAVGERASLEPQYPEVPHVDLDGKLLLPGNINAHDHLYSGLARGISMSGEPPQNFVQILERLWWRLDQALSADDVYYSGMLGFLEAVKRGTTSLIDHHASPGAIEGSLDQLARGSRQVGLRGCFCYEVTDRHGDQGARLGIEENARFLERCRRERDPMLAAAFGLHASFTVSPKTLKACLARCPERDTFFHVHVAEDRADTVHSREHYGSPALQRLLKEGLDGYPMLAAHCIHLEESEYDLLKGSDITVLHNPESNMNNAVGVAAVARLLKAGVPVCLGTDGMTQDLFQSVRVLPLTHRQAALHPQSFGYDQVYQVAYANNAALAERFFGVGLGRIEPGAAADMQILEYNPPTPMHKDNFLGHLIFGFGSARVHSTIVAGSFVVRDGRVLSVDEEEVLARCREMAQKLWARW